MDEKILSPDERIEQFTRELGIAIRNILGLEAEDEEVLPQPTLDNGGGPPEQP